MAKIIRFPPPDKSDLPPFKQALNRKWLSILNDQSADGRAKREWIAREVKAGRNFNDINQFDINDWIEE